MIKSIYIDGLKSLKDFKLDLQPGLNVLVGPNGSGKSNILTAFEFVSKLSKMDALRSKDEIGSTTIGELFDDLKNNKEIKIVLKGEKNIFFEKHNRYREHYGNTAIIDYNFECAIKFDPKLNNCIYFSEQKLNLKIFYGKNNIKLENFSVTMKNSDIDVEECNLFINNIDKNFMHHIDEIHLPNEFSMEYIRKNYYDMFLRTTSRILKYRSLVHQMSKVFLPLNAIVQEFDSGKIYNLDPYTIRHDIQKIEKPIISKNGSGLLSTLLRIYENYNGNKNLVFDNFNSNLNYEEIYETIIYFLKKVSPQISGLSVEAEYENGGDAKKIVGKVIFEKETQISINQMSDGVLKWLSLITALLTTENMFVLEEPENYFNPKMQQLVLDLMRETIEVEQNLVIFSTHSETILNLLDPNEVILTFFRDGKTIVKRIDDPNELKKEIWKTGYGLGWYFTQGTFEYENIN